MYQNSTIAATYGTMGYLVTIVASLSMCILPRAKLVQLTIQNSVRSHFLPSFSNLHNTLVLT